MGTPLFDQVMTNYQQNFRITYILSQKYSSPAVTTPTAENTFSYNTIVVTNTISGTIVANVLIDNGGGSAT